MKKSLKKIIIKSTAAMAFSFLLFSCGSAPKAEPLPVEAADTAETVEKEAESPVEESPAAEGNEEIPHEEEMEEPQPEEIKDEPVVEPVFELIEDIPGYYESDPEPVFLQPSEKTAEEEKPTEVLSDAQKQDEKTSEPENVLVSKEETPAEKTETKVEVIPQQNPAEKTTVAVVPAPAPVPEKKADPTPEKKNVPEVVESVEVAGITTAEEVESSELLSESNEPSDEEKSNEANDENKIVVVPSRAVEMKNSQYLDIVYPGTGWIYLGEVDNKTNMRYFGRKIGERNTVFSLRSREEGDTILHFYKNDQLTGKFIDDYLQVKIKGNNSSPEHAVAPSYAEVVPPKPEKKVLPQTKPVEIHEQDTSVAANIKDRKPAEDKTSKVQKTSATTPVKKMPVKSANTEAKKVPTQAPVVSANEDPSDNGTKTVIQQKASEGEHKPVLKSENSYASEAESTEKTTPTVSKNSIQNTENMAAEEILEKAKESFKNKKYEDTLAYLDDFFAKATTKIDEGLMLQGQTFESNSSVRNIKSALDTYETVVRRYPQSIHWPKANERITYLRKFYFNIR